MGTVRLCLFVFGLLAFSFFAGMAYGIDELTLALKALESHYRNREATIKFDLWGVKP